MTNDKEKIMKITYQILPANIDPVQKLTAHKWKYIPEKKKKKMILKKMKMKNN